MSRPTSDYHQLCLGSRRVLTLWGDPAHFRGLIAEMDGSTPKRRGVRASLLALQASGLLRRASRELTGEELAHVYRVVAPLLAFASRSGMHISSWSINWPVGDRHHRRYVLAVDRSGEPCLFAKVSVDASGDAELFTDAKLFKREHLMLRRLSSRPLPDWRTPRSLSYQLDGGWATLIQEPLPPGRQHLSPERIARHLPLGQPGQVRALGSTSWVHDALAKHMSPSFEQYVRTTAVKPVPVGLVNGDIRPSNAVWAGGGRWLFDWEFAAWDAPRQADIVLDILNTWLPRRGSRKLLLKTIHGASQRRGICPAELALSLLYLSTVGHRRARELMTHEWSPPPSLV